MDLQPGQGRAAQMHPDQTPRERLAADDHGREERRGRAAEHRRSGRLDEDFADEAVLHRAPARSASSMAKWPTDPAPPATSGPGGDTGAGLPVRGVHPRQLHKPPNLTRARLGAFHLRDPEHLRRSGRVMDGSSHPAILHPDGAPPDATADR